MPKPRRSTATVVHNTPNPGGRPRPTACRPGSEARPDARASDMSHSRGQSPRNVKSGGEPPASLDAATVSGRGGPDLDGLQSLGPLCQLELDRLPLLEAAVAVHLDGGVVNEDVFSFGLRDEAVPLLRVEPLDRSRCHPILPSVLLHPPTPKKVAATASDLGVSSGSDRAAGLPTGVGSAVQARAVGAVFDDPAPGFELSSDGVGPRIVAPGTSPVALGHELGHLGVQGGIRAGQRQPERAAQHGGGDGQAPPLVGLAVVGGGVGAAGQVEDLGQGSRGVEVIVHVLDERRHGALVGSDAGGLHGSDTVRRRGDVEAACQVVESGKSLFRLFDGGGVTSMGER